MYAIIVIWTIAWTASVNGPIMPLYVESLGVGIVGWGLLAASAAVGMFVLEWIWGALYDRVNLRLLMIFSVLSMSLLFPLYTVRSLVPYFVILQFVAGAIGVALGPTTRAFVSDESPKKSVGLFASLWWAVFILGRTIGPLLGAFIAQVWSFEYSFYASTILSLVTALLILLVFRNERAARTRNSLGVIGGLRSIARVRSLSFLFISAMFAFMGVSLMRSFLPLYASEQVQMSTLDVGILIGATSAAQLVALPMLGWLSDRFGRKRTVLFGFGLAAFTFLLFFLVGSQLQLLVVSLAVSIGLSASSLLLLALIPDVASKKLYGSVVGVYGSFEDVGLILGPVMFGLIWSAYTPIMIFAAGSITQIVGACFLWPLRQKQSRRG
jgi:DHA1 family multidrug resistance protein-like MFS transporter